MLNSIKNRIALDTAGSQPIYVQLQNQLRAIVKSCPPQTRLPSERLLAEELGIARNTLKAAINQLVDEHLIVRRGYQGSFTCGSSPQSPFAASEQINLQPFLADRKHTQAPLRLMVFEDYPTQSVFWRKTVDLFNAGSTQSTVELVAPPRTLCSSIHELRQLLEEQKIDLIQISRFPAYAGLAATLAPDMRARLNNPEEFLTELFSPQPSVLEGRLLPVYTNFYCCFYNRTLLAEHGFGQLAELWDCANPYPLLTQMRAQIPDGDHLTGSIISLILAQGFTAEPLKQLTPTWKLLREAADKRIYNPIYPVNMYHQLSAMISGRQSIFVDWSLTALEKFSDLGFEPGAFPLMPTAGRRALGSGSYLAIARQSPHYGEAHEFLEFMLSEATQERIVLELNVIPYSRRAPQYLAQLYPGYNEAWWLKALSRYTACEFHEWSEFLSFVCADIFREFQARHLDEAEAECRVQRLWPEFLQRKERELAGYEEFSIYQNQND